MEQLSNSSKMENSAGQNTSPSDLVGTNSGNGVKHNQELANSTLRRIACDFCRVRKVRCDRQNPTCSRCAKVGHKCRYSSRSKATPPKMDMSQFLMTLNHRLRQAEAQLACNLPAQDTDSSTIPWDDINLRAEGMTAMDPVSPPSIASSPQIASTQQSSLDLLALTMPPNNSTTKNTVNESGSTDFLFDAFASTTASDFRSTAFVAGVDQAFDFDPIFFDAASTSTRQTTPTLSSGILQRLYDQFFEIFHPIMPIINRNRFHAETLQTVLPIEVQLLCYAIAALGALSISELRCHANQCYDEARNLLDRCERQEGGGCLSNINTVQACVLLTLYEFKQGNFALAWMTLGHGIRLAKITGLDEADRNSSRAAQWGLRTDVHPQLSPADLEEGRRTFWSLYILDAFTSIRTSSVSPFNRMTSVPLPSFSEYPELTNGNDKMPSLRQVFDPAEKTLLSPFAGTSIMISLYRRCFDHVESSSQESSYAFWETHYCVDKAINHCRTSLLAYHVSNHSSDDPMCLSLRMNLDAVEINLHEAALVKVQKDDLPAALSAEAISRCMLAASDVVTVVQLGQQFTGKRLEVFRQLDQFLIWPITMAIQACFRMLYQGSDDVTTYIDHLNILCGAMRQLIDPEHIPPGLLEKADARVAEVERAKNKRQFYDY